MATPGSPSFFVRWAALPFWPRLWRESAEHDGGWTLLPLGLWALIAGVVFGIRVADAAHVGVYNFATYYEANADPLVLDGGHFSLTGERILRIENPDGSAAILFDPEETVRDDELKGTQSLVVRADKIVLRQPGQTREWPASEAAKLFGDHVLFDGSWVRRAADRWLYPGLATVLPVFAAIGNVAVCGAYACAVGLLLLLLRGQWLGLGYPACVTIALATSAFTIVADLALGVLGVALPLKGYVLWPLVMTALGFVALAGRGAEARS